MARGQASRYELIRRLGTGSIGVVYEAYDRERKLNVALKQLRVLSPAGLILLRREFRVLQGASHPNIIELHDLVLDETPPFITMELLSGQDFIAYVRQENDPQGASGAARTGDPAAGEDGGLPRFSDLVRENRLRHGLAQVAKGLHAIHEIGIVHRDLKPSNVMVTNEGRAVVMDFSIAVDARSHSEETNSGGVLIGTPDYMAPEQVTGAAPTPAADWYALGVVMYQAITGRLPFQGTWNQIVENKQAYDARSVRQLVSGVPDDLAMLCTALLSRHPHERPNGREILFQLGVSIVEDALAHTRRLERIPFIGRDEELALLQRLLDRARPGVGGCVLVTGPSGVGKSRLLQEFIDRQEEATNGALMVFHGSCHPVDQRPHNALDDIVDQMSRALARLPKERLREVLPGGHELLPRMFPACSRIPNIKRMPRVRESNLDALRTRTIDVLRALLERLARAQGLLLVIDDAQWADRDSVDLLCDIFRVAPPRGVFLIVALRMAQERDRSADDTLSGHSPARAEQHARAREQLLTLTERPDGELALGELRALARKEFLAWMYRDTPAPLDELGSGLPRLLIERARRALAVPDGDAHLREAAPPVDEDTVERLMIHQLRALAKRERTLIEICALLGYPAPLSLLARVVDISAAERSPSMDVLRARGLVLRVRGGREPWLAVGHEAVRTTVLAQLSDERRHELYQRLATAVQRSGNASNPELAASWYAARDFERAFPYLEVSAKSTRDRFAFHRSAAVYQAALEAVTASPHRGPGRDLRADRLTLARAEMLSRAGRNRESAVLFERVEDLDASVIDLGVRAADHRLRAGDIERGVARMVERATALEQQAGGELANTPGKGLSKLMRRMRVSWARRRHRPRHRDEVALSDLYRTDSLSSAAISLALIEPAASQQVHTTCLLRVLGHGERERVLRAQVCELVYRLVSHELDPDEVADQGSELAREARELGEHHGLALAHLGTGMAHLWRGRFGAADDALAEALEVATWKLPDAHWELLVAHFLHSITCIVQGKLRGRLSFISRVLERTGRSGDIIGRCLFASIPNMLCSMAADRIGPGLALIDKLEAALATERGVFLRLVLAIARVMGSLYAGRLDDARQTLERIDGLTIDPERGFFAVDLAVLRSRLAILEDDRERVAELARALERRASDLALGHAAVLRAKLAHDTEDVSGAVATLRTAASRFADTGAGIYVMAVHHRLGVILDGEDGAEHRQLADDWCATQRIANKSRMFDYLCPWSAKGERP